jgi:hypothetical protein
MRSPATRLASDGSRTERHLIAGPVEHRSTATDVRCSVSLSPRLTHQSARLAARLPSGGRSRTEWRSPRWLRPLGRVKASVAVVPHTRLAWAAGVSNAGLLLRWNGTRWQHVASSTTSTLNGVAAISRTDAWSVGNDVILHWNGTRWRQVPSHGPAGSLSGVSVTSRKNVWAVGTYRSSVAPFDRTLILHWNGKSWKQVPSPNPDSYGNWLYAVAAVSAADAWAVGTAGTGVGGPTLIEHWNGKAWKRVPSPSPPGTGEFDDQNVLDGVAAISARSAWAVGTVEEFYDDGGLNHDPIMEHWNGKRWRLVANPDPFPQETTLTGVTAVSATDAWAAGSTGGSQPILIDHWNGSAWTRGSAPSVTGGGDLVAVAASPTRGSAWAVGTDVGKTLTLYHC